MWPGGRYELGGFHKPMVYRCHRCWELLGATGRAGGSRDRRQEHAPAKLRGATRTITKAKPAPNRYRTVPPVQSLEGSSACDSVRLRTSNVIRRVGPLSVPVLPASPPACVPPCLHPATHGTPEAEQGCRAPRSFGQIV